MTETLPRLAEADPAHDALIIDEHWLAAAAMVNRTAPRTAERDLALKYYVATVAAKVEAEQPADEIPLHFQSPQIGTRMNLQFHMGLFQAAAKVDSEVAARLAGSGNNKGRFWDNYINHHVLPFVEYRSPVNDFRELSHLLMTHEAHFVSPPAAR